MKLGIEAAIFIAILLAFCTEHILPMEIKSFFYSISIFLKDILIFALPLVLMSLIAQSINKSSQSSVKMIILLFIVIFVSTFLGFNIAYFVGSSTLEHLVKIKELAISTNNIEILFELKQIKPIISMKLALLSGLILGFISTIFLKKVTKDVIDSLSYMSNIFLRKIFALLLPIFIFGFAIKIKHDCVLSEIFAKYPIIFLLMILSAFSYIMCFYLALSKFNIKLIFKCIKNVFPACVTAFTTMSSMVAFPLLLKAVEKNIGKKTNIPSIVAPICINIHMMANSFLVMIGSLIAMKSYGMDIPTHSEILIPILVLTMTSFGMSAVPGGGLIILIPVIEDQLSMTSEASALVMAIYIALDCVFTSMNTLGNGAFITIFYKIQNKIFRNNTNQN